MSNKDKFLARWGSAEHISKAINKNKNSSEEDNSNHNDLYYDVINGIINNPHSKSEHLDNVIDDTSFINRKK